MKSNALQSLSIDEIWNLHEQVTTALTRRMDEEKARLKERLRRLEYSDGSMVANGAATRQSRTCRPYPKVLPKYQNPRNPAERWSGRGKQLH
jgi:DNA-binding protein H-NS